MQKLVIAEKPSVARDLAKVLKATQRSQGFLHGNGWVVTWCIGHLVELCQPHEYKSDWKRWSLGSLPMIPEQFQLKPQKNTMEQFQVVKRLLHRKDIKSVVNACDAGREGELIFRYVYYLSKAQKPFQRLWISSMTDEAIREGFEKLRPGKDYDRLWHAARCRSEADWLVGMNATRAMTLRARQLVERGQESPLFSVGRVQTPTLTLITEREENIVHFEPVDYWQLYAYFQAEAGDYKGKWFLKKADRFNDEKKARALLERLQDIPGKIQKVQKRKAVERPPLLFDLTSLQRNANKRYGLSAARTLEVAQKLYEQHKLITYPRTDSSHLPKDMIPKIPGILKALEIDPYQPFAQELLGLKKIPAPKRIFNNSKVSDHHAILPNSKRPNLSRLSVEERKVYDLITRRFLAAFFPDAIFEKTMIITTIEDQSFVTRGKVIVQRGWRVVIGLPDKPQKKQNSDKEEDALLPAVQKGEDVESERLELLKKRTKAPPRYTEASLLSAMESAGKQLEDEEQKEAMKDSGLGTPATRASTIETIISRGYIQRKGKSVLPTVKGMQLTSSMPVQSLKSAELTGLWEAKLARIARGEEDSEGFDLEVRQFIKQSIQDIKQKPLQELIHLFQAASKADLPEAPQPKKWGRGASSKTTKRKTTPSSTKQTSYQKATATKSSKVNTSKTMMQLKEIPKADQAVKAKANQLGTCPECEKGQFIKGKRAWGCDRYREGCHTTIPFEISGHSLTQKELDQLLQKGKTRLQHDFIDQEGVSFSATIAYKKGKGLEVRKRKKRAK